MVILRSGFFDDFSLIVSLYWQHWTNIEPILSKVVSMSRICNRCYGDTLGSVTLLCLHCFTTLVYKGCICYFEKWQIPPFNTKVRMDIKLNAWSLSTDIRPTLYQYCATVGSVCHVRGGVTNITCSPWWPRSNLLAAVLLVTVTQPWPSRGGHLGI